MPGKGTLQKQMSSFFHAKKEMFKKEKKRHHEVLIKTKEDTLSSCQAK